MCGALSFEPIVKMDDTDYIAHLVMSICYLPKHSLSLEVVLFILV